MNQPITHRTFTRYNQILAALQGKSLTSLELADIINISKKSISNILIPMVRKKYIAQKPHPTVLRWYVYTGLIDSLPESILVGEDPPTKVEPPKPLIGARVISFDTDDMKSKLTALDKQYRKDRKSQLVFISSHWNNA
jgi:hypothetical protein